MIRFSTLDLLDEQMCYDYLVSILHPGGLCCPRCNRPASDAGVHRRDLAPLLRFRCPCKSIYNAFAGTVWQGTHHSCARIVRILQGFAQGVSTLHLAKELGIDNKHLLERRHRLQGFLEEHAQRTRLPDRVVESDEMYQNAGEKRSSPSRSGRPAAAARQQGQRPWNVGKRQAAGSRHGGPRERRGALGSMPWKFPGGVAAAR